MTRLLAPLFLLAALLSGGVAHARSPAPQPGGSPPSSPPHVALVTEKGTITVVLDPVNAPVTSANFLRYVDQRRFDNMVFYRVMRLAWGQQPNGLIQTGLRGDPRRVLKPIAHEPTNRTGLLHKAGALSMARMAPGTATADFSILLSDLEGLDANPASDNPDLKAGYAVFGHVVTGMDVARAIFDSPLSPTKGQGVLKGQMLEPEIRVLRARRVAAPAAAAALAPVPAP